MNTLTLASSDNSDGQAVCVQGIATTRAGCIMTSDTQVVRDMLYNGNPQSERASLVMRIAPTFFRFGSFEIFKKTDTQTGGSSSLHQTLDLCPNSRILL